MFITRYFIIPFLLLRLQVKPSSPLKLGLEFALLLALNSAVFHWMAKSILLSPTIAKEEVISTHDQSSARNA